MMIGSYKSFRSIILDSESLFHKLSYNYWAHIEGERSVETLYEHSRLVADYLIKVVEAHGIEAIVDNIIHSLTEKVFPDSALRYPELIKEIFINSIFWHDLGKVNPNFQALRMRNPSFRQKELKIGYQHSLPGAYLFCSYYFEEILRDGEIQEDDQSKLFFLTTSMSNPIIRHHSSYLDFRKDYENREVELGECHEFLRLYEIIGGRYSCKDVLMNFGRLEEQFEDDLRDLSAREKGKARLEIYLLIKLSYSLLTACDFYATNEFHSGINIFDFGLIDDPLRGRIKENFWSLKAFNADLRKNFHFYLSKPFGDLQERCNGNLNVLRQKLTAEVVSTLRKNPDRHWYYIEAPTGAGKTNLSLGCISELLDHDKTLTKIFYVFPFTTLITQTYEEIKNTMGLTDIELIQLHSRSGLHRKPAGDDEDAKYGDERVFYLHHLFANYPVVVTSHVRFFEIIKGNDKETNYMFHRLCNSIVVIDELQSYNPKHWDKMVYFIEHYAKMLNIRFIIMSATLPKIDEMSETARGTFVSLTPNRDFYFRNPNVQERVTFDFSLLDALKDSRNNKEKFLAGLAERIKEEAEDYAAHSGGKVRVLVEFITKSTASCFFSIALKDGVFEGFDKYLISGDILEPRRREIIDKVKGDVEGKVLLVCTQVVEAGVDIDMDLGFKNHAILDSDEQFAGRVNRNALKDRCKVFLFELDSIRTIYGKDERYKLQMSNNYLDKNWRSVLVEKRFHELYEKVFEERLRLDWTDADRFQSYLSNIMRLDFQGIQRDFALIEDNESRPVFIPLDIEVPKWFEDPKSLEEWDVLTTEGKISGEKVFRQLRAIQTRNREGKDLLGRRVDLKKMVGLVSLFIVNVYPRVLSDLSTFLDPEKEALGFKYLAHHPDVYSYENGFRVDKFKEGVLL